MTKVLTALLFTLTLGFGLEVGQMPSTLTLEGDKGGLVTGGAFSSTILRDKVYVLFYVDPDEKDMNEHVTKVLKAEKFDRANYGSVAIINMAATWLPNFAIASKLKKKQEEFPDTIYAKDLESVLVKEWDLEDDSSNVVLFGKDGKVLFLVKGKLSDENVAELISIIKVNL
jgi:predicted transcriptional regulator